jgi:hypothetical protein
MWRCCSSEHITLKRRFLWLLNDASSATYGNLQTKEEQWPPLWSSGQRSRVRFPALPNFLRSSGSGTGSTQPREDNWGTTWMKK